MGHIEARMKAIGVELPAKALVPRANALLWKRSGNLIFLAGQGPAWDGEIIVTGRLGAGLSLEQGQYAARLCALNLLYQLREACGGDLDRATNCLALNGYVRCTENYADQPLVINGASTLIVEIFGEAGRHTRTAIGCNALPRDMPVEISAVWEGSG
jgi:enamine deaminase RidA (YjgF/YER057c/UK114 family)